MVHIWRKTLNQPCAIPSLLFNQRKRSLITALAKKTVVPLFGKSGLATRAFTPTARSINDFTQPVQVIWTNREKENLCSRIKSLGYAGTLAYGFLNTLYYGVGLVIAWIFFCEAPRGLSLREFTKIFMQTAAFTWAGSQLTKGFRAAVAIALAKPVDALIRQTSMKLNVAYAKVVLLYAAACIAAVFACITTLALIWCFK